ncbi:MAG: HipA family kinase [Clostridium sp.]
MDVIHIDELLCFIGNGATHPIHAIGNNTRYVVKTFNNPEGNKVLISELVSYYIAKQLNLPIPNAVLGTIDSNTIIDKGILESDDFNQNCYGLSFCSELLHPVTSISSSKMLTMSSNYKWLIPNLMLFDHLIYNKDRNKGNLLISLSKSNKSLYIIDHSHVFSMEALWNSFGFSQRINENDFNDMIIMQDNWYHYSNFKKVMNIDMLTMQETINHFKDNLNTAFFKSLIDKIPVMWENDKSELESLINYLIYRMEHLEEFASLIMNIQY